MQIILPSISTPDIIKQMPLANMILGTTNGLAKSANEDRVGYLLKDSSLRICLADGHWGDAAADALVTHWLDDSLWFPESRQQAIEHMKRVQGELYKKSGKPNMDEEQDRPPEASVLVFEIQGNLMRVASYGDCRLMVANNGATQFVLESKETWLGAFSYLGLRNRLPIEDGLVFQEIRLNKGDHVLAFSDGIDQCVYEKPTLSNSYLAAQTTDNTLEGIFDTILNEVFANGAEDNASLVICKAN
jgi:serine/threonine protein phosphatase PrpC